MRVPLSWLREYVEFGASAEEVADMLTMSGTEAETIEIVGSACDGVVAGEVKSIKPHPHADRLRICEVDLGNRIIQVVCGADNFREGDKVPVIEAGGTLPDGTKIREADLKGVKSSGMLCSERELALSDDHSGLMILPAEVKPGTPLAEIVGPPEKVLVLEITWNRPDCLSIIGIAREVAALTGGRIKLPDVRFSEEGERVEDLIGVRIDDAAGCPRYTARVLSDVKLAPSPMWMQRRLAACGVRAINNLVDITNYVMLETGHPLHAFDYNLIKGKKITVRRGNKGDRMATLDGIERVIDCGTILIADEAGPIALAGVMGGAGSEIKNDTRTVLLESASFDPASIRKTSSCSGLVTESSHRFERGVDPANAEWAGRRAAYLMVTVAGAVACKGVRDEFPGKSEGRTVKCSFRRMRALLGIEISDSDAVRILDSLEVNVTGMDGDAFTVSVPSFRPDITIEADVIEEIARVYGVDNVPARVPEARIVPGATDVEGRAVESCRNMMIGLGFCEIMHYSFLSDRLLNVFKMGDDAGRVVLPNPVSADHSVMRPSLVPQLVETMGRNLSRQVCDTAFFEIGSVFLKRSDGCISEEDRLSVGLMGNVRPGIAGRVRKNAPEEMFLALKGAIEGLCDGQKTAQLEIVPVSARQYEEGSAAEIIIGGEKCGVMGLINGKIRANWRMTEPVAVAEIAVKPLIEHVFELRKLREIPVYPSITRDVAILVSDNITHEQVMKVIRGAAPKELTDVKLFDIFKGEGLADSCKSLAYSLVYRSHQNTLTDEDANRYHEAIKEAIVSELNAEIR